jgi:hypothetical protein
MRHKNSKSSIKTEEKVGRKVKTTCGQPFGLKPLLGFAHVTEILPTKRAKTVTLHRFAQRLRFDRMRQDGPRQIMFKQDLRLFVELGAFGLVRQAASLIDQRIKLGRTIPRMI